ncbi:unnamed protein product [Hymenolepis diminuta]|nr:unnamed protein product [Hymenolepis diminuta]
MVLLIIGFPGNIISFLVWSNKRMYHGNSAAVYLAALSLNDTVVLVIVLLRDISLIWQVPLQRTSGSCEAETTISNTFQYASPIFVLAFTLERWLAICQPFLVSRICSVKRALRICIGIILITLVICLPFAYLMTNDESGCKARSDIVILYFTSALEIIFSLVVPLLILVFNCLVINEMAKIQRAQAKKMIRGMHRKDGSIGDVSTSRPMKGLLRKSNGNSIAPSGLPSTPILRNSEIRKTEFDNLGGETSSPKFKSTTIMLLVVSFYVIFATLLGGLMYALSNSGKFNLDTYSKLPKGEFESSPAVATAMEIRKAKIVCDKFALSHFAMGFVLYFCTGKNFREEVARMFGRLCCCNYSKHHDNARNSFVSENDHSAISHRLSRDTRRGESFVTSKATQRENKLKILKKNIPFLKRGRSRDDFPGLELCGRRGVRQPSKLQLTPKININGDTLAPL